MNKLVEKINEREKHVDDDRPTSSGHCEPFRFPSAVPSCQMGHQIEPKGKQNKFIHARARELDYKIHLIIISMRWMTIKLELDRNDVCFPFRWRHPHTQIYNFNLCRMR